MPQTDKALSYIGICKKAGRIVIGTEMTCAAMKEAKIRLAVYSADASDNTKKRVTDRCAYYGVRCAEGAFTSGALGGTVGSHGDVAVVGITDEGLANAILNSI